MKNTWKWLLIIVVVGVFLAGAGFLAGKAFGYGYVLDKNPHFGDWSGRGDFDEWRHPMLESRGFMPFYGGFFLLGGLLRLVVPLALVGLLAYGIYMLGKRSGAPAPVTGTAASASQRACAQCGKPAQDDWTSCPYCGTAL